MSITDGLLGLMREMAPVVLFFFIAFLPIFVMFKLFVSQYEIRILGKSKIPPDLHEVLIEWVGFIKGWRSNYVRSSRTANISTAIPWSPKCSARKSPV